MTENLNGNEASVREFVIGTSRKPFLRVGWSNLYIGFMVVSAFLSQKIVTHFDVGYGMSLVVAAAVGGMFLVMYTRSVSRIVIENSFMHFICAIHRERLHVPSIKRIKVLGVSPSSWIIIVVFLDNKVLPRVFDFVKLYPSAKEFHATVTELREFLRLTGTK